MFLDAAERPVYSAIRLETDIFKDRNRGSTRDRDDRNELNSLLSDNHSKSPTENQLFESRDSNIVQGS
jgi:hypothetical protein